MGLHGLVEEKYLYRVWLEGRSTWQSRGFELNPSSLRSAHIKVSASCVVLPLDLSHSFSSSFTNAAVPSKHERHGTW